MTVRIIQGVDALGRLYTSRRKDKQCRQCGQVIARRGSTVKFCSRACYGLATAGVPKRPEDVARRRNRHGEDHPKWRGDSASDKAGRKRALRMYRDIGPCTRCGDEHGERHHKDGNTRNNEPSNVEILCRRCHMESDGRLAMVRANPGKGCVCR